MKDTRSNAELNPIIAEWMGWTFHREENTGNPELYEPEHWTDQSGNAANWFFCEDLDAIHEAWTHLKNYQQMLSFNKHLKAQPWPDDYGHKTERWTNATARQRAEALVKVIEAKGEK